MAEQNEQFNGVEFSKKFALTAGALGRSCPTVGGRTPQLRRSTTFGLGLQPGGPFALLMRQGDRTEKPAASLPAESFELASQSPARPFGARVEEQEKMRRRRKRLLRLREQTRTPSGDQTAFNYFFGKNSPADLGHSPLESLELLSPALARSASAAPGRGGPLYRTGTTLTGRGGPLSSLSAGSTSARPRHPKAGTALPAGPRARRGSVPVPLASPLRFGQDSGAPRLAKRASAPPTRAGQNYGDTVTLELAAIASQEGSEEGSGTSDGGSQDAARRTAGASNEGTLPDQFPEAGPGHGGAGSATPLSGTASEGLSASPAATAQHQGEKSGRTGRAAGGQLAPLIEEFERLEAKTTSARVLLPALNAAAGDTASPRQKPADPVAWAPDPYSKAPATPETGRETGLPPNFGQHASLASSVQIPRESGGSELRPSSADSPARLRIPQHTLSAGDGYTDHSRSDSSRHSGTRSSRSGLYEGAAAGSESSSDPGPPTPSSDGTAKRLYIEEQAGARIDTWKTTDGYKMLSANLREAIERGMRRQRHSDFYYKLSEVTEKVYMYTESHQARVPAFERSFKERRRQKQLEELKRWKKEQMRERRHRTDKVGRATQHQGTTRATCKPAQTGPSPGPGRGSTMIDRAGGLGRPSVTLNFRGTSTRRSGAGPAHFPNPGLKESRSLSTGLNMPTQAPPFSKKPSADCGSPHILTINVSRGARLRPGRVPANSASPAGIVETSEAPQSARRRESSGNDDLAEIRAEIGGERLQEREHSVELRGSQGESQTGRPTTSPRGPEPKPRWAGGKQPRAKYYHHPPTGGLLQPPLPAGGRRGPSDQPRAKLHPNILIGKSTMFQKNQAFASSKPASVRGPGERSEGRPGRAGAASLPSLQGTFYSTASGGLPVKAKAAESLRPPTLPGTLRGKPRRRSQEDLQASRELADYVVKKILEQPDPSALHAALDRSLKHQRARLRQAGRKACMASDVTRSLLLASAAAQAAKAGPLGSSASQPALRYDQVLGALAAHNTKQGPAGSATSPGALYPPSTRLNVKQHSRADPKLHRPGRPHPKRPLQPLPAPALAAAPKGRTPGAQQQKQPPTLKLGFTEARREIYLNLIQDRHAGKLAKEEQPRGRDYEVVRSPQVQLQGTRPGGQPRAQQVQDDFQPARLAPLIAVQGQQGTDLRQEASEQPARPDVRVQASRSSGGLSGQRRSGEELRQVGKDGGQGSLQGPGEIGHPADQSADIVSGTTGTVEGLRASGTEESEAEGEASGADAQDADVTIERGPGARAAQAANPTAGTAAAQLRTLTSGGRPGEAQEARGIQLAARGPHAKPAGARQGQRLLDGNQSRKPAGPRGPLAAGKPGASGTSSSRCELTTLASAYPTFQVKSMASSGAGTGSDFQRARARAAKYTDAYLSPPARPEPSSPTTPGGLTTLFASQPRARDPGPPSSTQRPAQPKRLLKKGLHQSQPHLQQLAMVFDGYAKSRPQVPGGERRRASGQATREPKVKQRTGEPVPEEEAHAVGACGLDLDGVTRMPANTARAPAEAAGDPVASPLPLGGRPQSEVTKTKDRPRPGASGAKPAASSAFLAQLTSPPGREGAQGYASGPGLGRLEGRGARGPSTLSRARGPFATHGKAPSEDLLHVTGKRGSHSLLGSAQLRFPDFRNGGVGLGKAGDHAAMRLDDRKASTGRLLPKSKSFLAGAAPAGLRSSGRPARKPAGRTAASSDRMMMFI